MLLDEFYLSRTFNLELDSAGGERDLRCCYGGDESGYKGFLGGDARMMRAPPVLKDIARICDIWRGMW